MALNNLSTYIEVDSNAPIKQKGFYAYREENGVVYRSVYNDLERTNLISVEKVVDSYLYSIVVKEGV